MTVLRSEPGSIDTQDSVPGEVDSACRGDIQGWKALGAIYAETLAETWQEEPRWRLGRDSSVGSGGQAERHRGKTQAPLVDFGMKDRLLFYLFASHCSSVGWDLCPETSFCNKLVGAP